MEEGVREFESLENLGSLENLEKFPNGKIGGD
jgi:hypothetical protein